MSEESKNDRKKAKKRFVLAGAHTGNVVNGIAPVARQLRLEGHSVVVYLQEDQAARDSYLAGGAVKEALGELDVYGRSYFNPSDVRIDDRNCDAVICAMSPVLGPYVPNIEISALNAGLISDLPVFGVSDFPGGSKNTGWRDETRKLTTLFTPMPESQVPCKCVVSGWGALEKWRGVDVKQMKDNASHLLGITGDYPVLYVFFSPERESPLALEHLALVIDDLGFEDLTIVINRHGREKTTPVEGNATRFRRAMRLLDKRNIVIDHSPEYADLPADDLRSIESQFRPKQFLSYQHILALSAGNGLALTFFGTDGLVAPYLASQGVLSACWLDPVFGGAVLKREKQIEKFDFPGIWQPDNDDYLAACLMFGLDDGDPSKFVQRTDHLAELVNLYPVPEKPAAQIIVDEILRQLG